jgi:hypothetical protein
MLIDLNNNPFSRFLNNSIGPLVQSDEIIGVEDKADSIKTNQGSSHSELKIKQFASRQSLRKRIQL